jgi:hypothetical protein
VQELSSIRLGWSLGAKTRSLPLFALALLTAIRLVFVLLLTKPPAIE